MGLALARSKYDPKEKTIFERFLRAVACLRQQPGLKGFLPDPNGAFRKTLFERLFAFEAGAGPFREKEYPNFFAR